MRTVNISEARRRLSALLREVEGGGGGAVITRRGQPVARLSAVAPAFDRAKARAAGEGLRAARKGVSLGGLLLKDLVDEGRR